MKIYKVVYNDYDERVIGYFSSEEKAIEIAIEYANAFFCSDYESRDYDDGSRIYKNLYENYEEISVEPIEIDIVNEYALEIIQHELELKKGFKN